MTCAEFEALLSSLSGGWTARRYDEVAEHFADDVFYSDPLNYTFHDRQSLLHFFQEDEGLEQSCVFHSAVFDEDRQLGVAEYSYSGTHNYLGTVWITLADDKIKSWREYQHMSSRSWEEFWEAE